MSFTKRFRRFVCCCLSPLFTFGCTFRSYILRSLMYVVSFSYFHWFVFGLSIIRPYFVITRYVVGFIHTCLFVLRLKTGYLFKGVSTLPTPTFRKLHSNVCFSLVIHKKFSPVIIFCCLKFPLKTGLYVLLLPSMLF